MDFIVYNKNFNAFSYILTVYSRKGRKGRQRQLKMWLLVCGVVVDIQIFIQPHKHSTYYTKTVVV